MNSKVWQVTTAIVALAFALNGCASTKNIDLSKVDSQCGQSCSAKYSDCISRFTFFPLETQHQCTDALKLCAQSCPARTASNESAPAR
jgi:hypothetical protein